MPYDPKRSVEEQILLSFRVSLKNLRTDYLDSYLLHSPLETLEKSIEAWRTLMRLQDEGKVRMIGLSNAYDLQVIQRLHEMRKVQVVQNRWYEKNLWDKDVWSFCMKQGIQYQYAFPVTPLIDKLSNISRSFWTLTGSPSLLRHPTLLALSKRISCTPAQVVFRLAQLRGIVPLAGSTNETRMKDGVETEKLNLKIDAECARAVDVLNTFIDGEGNKG